MVQTAQIKLALPTASDDFSGMSFTGTVEHGMVKLPPDVTLPDGTEVRIEPLLAPAVKLVRRHGYLVAVGERQITWQQTRKAMDEFP